MVQWLNIDKLPLLFYGHLVLVFNARVLARFNPMDVSGEQFFHRSGEIPKLRRELRAVFGQPDGVVRDDDVGMTSGSGATANHGYPGPFDHGGADFRRN